MKEVLRKYGILLLMMLVTATAGAQDIGQADKKFAVSGVVTDQRGRRLPYVNVSVSGERVSTVTNEEGFHDQVFTQDWSARFDARRLSVVAL